MNKMQTMLKKNTFPIDASHLSSFQRQLVLLAALSLSETTHIVQLISDKADLKHINVPTTVSAFCLSNNPFSSPAKLSTKQSGTPMKNCLDVVARVPQQTPARL